MCRSFALLLSPSRFHPLQPSSPFPTYLMLLFPPPVLSVSLISLLTPFPSRYIWHLNVLQSLMSVIQLLANVQALRYLKIIQLRSCGQVILQFFGFDGALPLAFSLRDTTFAFSGF